MSGGKGGGSTTSVEVPEYIEQAAQRNLNRADRLSKMGYVPEYGPTVAAFTPMQEAAFQNTADTAGAFGMAAPTSQRDIMGGMDAPTEYAGGLRGYSSAPIYQGMVDEFAADRPAQKSYMDSFFIDPYSGEYGSNVQPFMDYTSTPTMAANARNESNANRANELAIANANNAGDLAVANAAYKGPSSVYYNNEDTVMNTIGGGASASGGSAGSFDSPSDTGSYGGSLMTGGPTDVTGNVSTYDPGLVITNPITGNTSTGGYVFDPTDYNSDYGNAPAGYEGGYTSVGDMFDGGGAGRSGSTYEGGGVISDLGNSVTTSEDLPGNVISRALNIGAGKKDDSDDGYAGSSDDGCVVATHAVESGAFTPSMKREAVVWCMNVLHGKWWGEAIRRGYRHLGNKKIAQGKAREHYSEFRRYIAFASGKDRTLRGAVTFTIRTTQFFAVGLVKKDA